LVRTVSVSDIHLGHSRVCTYATIAGLKKVITKELLNKTDLLIIAGDVFDEGLILPDDRVYAIIKYASELVRLAVITDTIVRVLEGTPIHDRGQSILFKLINDARDNRCNLKYISTLEIEYIPELDSTILYVPDEYRPTCKQTELEVRTLLASKNLKTVNIAAMHGWFNYQVPKGLKVDCHDEKYYLSIVTGQIYIGHEHEFSTYDRITAQGSFNCLAHGQRTSKGLVYFDGNKITRIINKDAAIFKTLSIQKLTLQDSFTKIKNILATFPMDRKSFLKMLYSEDAQLEIIKGFKQSFAHVQFTTEKLKNAREASIIPIIHAVEKINKESIEDQMRIRLQKKNTPPQVMEAILFVLAELK
jgi:DNA repair exonuclease SbcCD nuclease subunit